MASIIWVRSLPARPTKGRPCASSSAPGPSPTKTSSALGLPSAKTMFLRALWSLQRLQSPRSSRTFNSVSFEILFIESKSDGEAGRGAKAGAVLGVAERKDDNAAGGGAGVKGAGLKPAGAGRPGTTRVPGSVAAAAMAAFLVA